MKTHEASILISRFFISRRPTAWPLIAPFFLHAYRIADWEEGNCRAGPSIVQKCSRHHLGQVRHPVVLHLHVSEPLLELSLLPPSTFRRSGPSLEAESDGNTWRCRSHSDELLQSMGSSPSTDSFLMEGEKKMHLHLLVFP